MAALSLAMGATMPDNWASASSGTGAARAAGTGVGPVVLWKVVSPDPINIRAETSIQSALLGRKGPGERFLGRNVGGWVQLADEPGYVVIVGAATGLLLLEPCKDDVDAVCNWRVVAENPVNVRQEMSIESAKVSEKRYGDQVRGRQRGGWVELVDEAGFVVIMGAYTGKKLLERIPGTAEAEPLDTSTPSPTQPTATVPSSAAASPHSRIAPELLQDLQRQLASERKEKREASPPPAADDVNKVKSDIHAALEKARMAAEASKKAQAAASLAPPAVPRGSGHPWGDAPAYDPYERPAREKEKEKEREKEGVPALGELRAPTGVRAAVAVVQHEALVADAARRRSRSPHRARPRGSRSRSRDGAPRRTGPAKRSRSRRGSRDRQGRSRSRRRRSPSSSSSHRRGNKSRIFSDRPQAPDMSWAAPPPTAAPAPGTASPATMVAASPSAASGDSRAADRTPLAVAPTSVPEWLRDLAMPAPVPAPTGPTGKKYIKMPDEYIKVLIGKGGETIRSVIEQSGAIIKIESGPRDPVAIVSITGNVQRGEHCIREALRARGLELPEQNGLVVNQVQSGSQSSVRRDDIQIPSELVKHFLGNKGANLKVLEEAAGGAVCIKVLPLTLPGGFQRIQVTGMNRAIAEPLVLARIEELKRWVGGGHANGGIR